MLSAISLISGMLTWTLLEYLIHRFLGHQKKENNPITVEHHRHHREGNYFAPLWKKLLLAAVVVPLIALPAGMLLGFYYALLFALGLTGTYLFYEVFHKLLHVMRPLTSYGRWARKHHFYHHFKNPSKNHGVTTPLWDYLFGTYEQVKQPLRVPQKMAMPWLVKNPEPYRKDYLIISRKADAC
ncbi:MAG: hypothetical protein KatS3mg031_1891 [Chitinophagales bacterium]|nr:MAG: hypothetical protein KatS3mg031_1891 [Chitinophagales bacterium]